MCFLKRNFSWCCNLFYIFVSNFINNFFSYF